MAAEHYIAQTIVDRVKFWGEREPDTPAFIFWGLSGRNVLSRHDVLDLSSRFAHRLTTRGVVPGDVVCIALPNSPERVVVEFGVHLAGGVSMNGQVLRADGQDLAESLNKTNCKLIVVDKRQENGGWQVLKKYFKILTSERHFDQVQSEVISSITHIEQVAVNRKADDFINDLRSENTMMYSHTKPSDLASIFTTSGSSGYTKLVKHSQRNILRTGFLFNKCTKLSPPEKLYQSSMLGWLGGYPSHYLVTGCPRVLMDMSDCPTTNLAQFLWNIVCEEDISTATFQPAHTDMLYDLAKKEGGLKGRKLKLLITGGQPMKKGNFSSIGLLTESYQICYGATELGYIATLNIAEDGVKSYTECTVGFPLPGVMVKIEKNNQSVDNRGEILVKSETLCAGYIDETNLASAFLEDGWFRTGDVGYLTDEGCLAVEGRCSDAINHGAYILYPTWLEKTLAGCPGVKQVVIVPVPDPILHQEICACVQADEVHKPSGDDIIDFCRQQLALDVTSPLNVVPRYVVFFNNFPLTSTSKLDRKTLTVQATVKLGL